MHPILATDDAHHLIQCNSSKRIRRSDLFMLFALWMERYPRTPSLSLSLPNPLKRSRSDLDLLDDGHHRPSFALPTGAVLVDARDRVVALEHTGEAHAVVRSILSAPCEVQGCDIYVSRFPCSLCVKLIVQAGIRKIYYFPAAQWEMAVPPEVAAASIDRDPGWAGREAERAEKNRKSVLRLIMNNPIAMTLFIPQWDHGDIPESDLPDGDDMDDNPFDASLSSLQAPPSDSLHANGSHNHLTASKSPVLVASATVSDSPETVATFTPHIQWPLDESVGKAPGIASRWDTIKLKFRRTCVAISLLDLRYQVRVVRSSGKGVWSSPVRARIEVDDGTGRRTSDVEEDEEIPKWARHGMVLAHIAARRTDDPKLGVGSVLVDQGRYISIGWNGYPKKSQHLDYPQAGADDSVEDEELKYDYILHSEQNALLWRNPTGVRLDRGWLISTKMPCDECSPMVFDFGFTRVITIPQIPKSLDDPARLRGLTYEKISSLMERVFVFDL